MKKNQIKLGYEIGTNKEVFVTNSHLIVTGLTQQSGKTTTLEALIQRSNKKAIVFKTKVGEKSFLQGTIIPPYFKDKSDWQYIQGLIEATIKEKVGASSRAKIIQICKQTNGKSLLGFKKKVDERLLEEIGVSEKDILTNLQAYLELVLPKLQSINFSETLELSDGMNIMDLERFSRDSEVQSLIIKSVLEEVLHKHKGVIIVIPESWKFIPQGMGNPCKQSMEEFIRQGATNENFVWIDSQDISNVDKSPLKQISTWVLGYQSEINEVKHTIAQIPLPKNLKPTTDDIQNLGKGIFYLATREKTLKVYVQPSWLSDKKAIEVSLGNLKLEDLDAPETLAPFKVAMKKEVRVQEQPVIDFTETSKRFNKEMNEMREDFFKKLEENQEQFNKIYNEIFEIKNQPKQEQLDEDTIIAKLLQKVPTASFTSSPAIDEEAIIAKVLARVPQSQGSVVYEVSPLEKIKKDFLEDAKTKILSDISGLSNNGKKALKYLESRGVGCSISEICMKGFLYVNGTGGYSKIVNDSVKELSSILVGEKQSNGKCFGRLKSRIESLLATHEAKDEEITQVYNHILMEMLK